ncbi:hypothetical protein NEF87_004334 [Candidatus Lokiarchaeum ossiferum]|uniref:Polysaccharide biosynthesis protein CapD-like domain-containing protein n=1 Tax=Candidatus Lokiarchaeum ossiferum TaxID=2951803 RepID=A0ABY6HZP5_9ARCH|nr:hypothetical protein NEF87_004334 [Candidatus Lokiarchaeum sp. B-35]
MEYKDLLNFFQDKSILVTGGTGTIGSEIVIQLLKYNPKVIRILSNSENELWEMKVKLESHTKKLRFLLGDIRDYKRVKKAMDEMDYVFNAAAIKHVPISEYNPMEAITVNVLGLENIIEAAVEMKIKNLIHISTDKAVSPTTAMGATKMLGERICISKSCSKGTHKLKISCVRFGNVLGSRGSIIPLIKNNIKSGNEVTLTGEKMKRFFMSIDQAVNLVLRAMTKSQGSEIFVLKMNTIFIRDLIEVIIEEYAPKIGKNPDSIQIKIAGPRIGEKYDEELISPIEYVSCYDTDDLYIIYPSLGFDVHERLPRNTDYQKVKVNEDFIYSTENQTPLTKGEISALLNDLDLLK